MLLAVIVVALLGGAAWRQTNGRMRAPRAVAALELARGTTPGTPASPMSAEPADQKLRPAAL